MDYLLNQKRKMEEEEKERYEQDLDAHIEWNNERYAPHGLELIRSSELKKSKVKTYLNSFLIFLGLLIIGIAIFYGVSSDGFKSTIGLSCNETLICGDNTCPDLSCPEQKCNPILSCDFPNELNITIINWSG